MDQIRTLTERLKAETNKRLQVEILQELAENILREYMIELSPYFRIYPIEVEAYYYNPSRFPDASSLRNELQKNRFGQLYFHRGKPLETDVILEEDGGMHLCLSDSDAFNLSFFIRSARINDESRAVSGPDNLLRRVAEYVCSIKSDKLTLEDIQKLKRLEELENLLVRVETEKKGKTPIFSSRIGIDRNTYYEKAGLRALINVENLNNQALCKY